MLLDERDVPEFVAQRRPFRYDLYRVPFNDGRGGTAEPVAGAAANGRSNFFPKYSPDGKWVVFCQANSYMLLQPDSELYIMPARGGGAPRRLRANTPRMNSWHSWSSNSRWLVFSSKVNGPYTQLFLTHIDENGNDSPPVLLERYLAAAEAIMQRAIVVSPPKPRSPATGNSPARKPLRSMPEQNASPVPVTNSTPMSWWRVSP